MRPQEHSAGQETRSEGNGPPRRDAELREREPDASLSYQLTRFLCELGKALHKHTLYPEQHPELEALTSRVIGSLEPLLRDEDRLSIGVARHQLVVNGVATDPTQPILRMLAGQLHRHHLGAATFRRHVTAPEMGSLLALLAQPHSEEGPLGLRPDALTQEWEHVSLHPLTYERLQLLEDRSNSAEVDVQGDRAAALWLGLARAALAAEPDAHIDPTDTTRIAALIDQQDPADAYDQVILGYLLQIAEELRSAKGPETSTLRQRASQLIGNLKIPTLRRFLHMGGDQEQRRQFLHAACEGMAAGAVVQLVQATADVSKRSLSVPMLRLLTKLGARTECGTTQTREQAQGALRQHVTRLLDGWALADPTPGSYSEVLEGLASTTRPDRPQVGTDEIEATPLRLIHMALELEAFGPTVEAAIDRSIVGGDAARLVDLLDAVTTRSATVDAIWSRVASPLGLSYLLDCAPVSLRLLDRLIERMGVSAAEPLLDALMTVDSESMRRALVDRVAAMGPAIGPLVSPRLQPGEPSGVLVHLLGLLRRLPRLPHELSVAPLREHPDVEVRQAALAVELMLPSVRDQALTCALDDSAAPVVRVALEAASRGCPASSVERIVELAHDEATASQLRCLSIRVLGRTTSPISRAALLHLVTRRGRFWWCRERLRPKSPELLEALRQLARGWRADPTVSRILDRAGASRDREVRVSVSEGEGRA